MIGVEEVAMNVEIYSDRPTPDPRAKLLAKVYALILSWPDPREQKPEPAAGDLGGDTAAGSEELPANTADILDSIIAGE